MSVRVFLRALRVHQWVKNLLVFVPLIMAHLLVDQQSLSAAVRAFFAFSLLASSVYLTNDLFDLEADRNHPHKRHRPLASGQMSVRFALALIPCLIVASGAMALGLPADFWAALASYLVVTLLYSMALKKVIVIDIISLAGLYTLRILAGGMASAVAVSQWLIAFSMFFFLSLACLKRFSELRALRLADEQSTRRRGYLTSDLEQVSQMGAACACLSVLVFALYLNGREVTVLYQHANTLWLVCPALFYWLSRMWILAHRGEVSEDPILFAVKDRVSYLVGAAVVGIFLVAL